MKECKMVNELKRITSARDVLYNFCENYKYCEKCQVTLLVNQAYDKYEQVTEFEYKQLKKAIELAYDYKLNIYLYPDKVIVKNSHYDDCYLTHTTIIDSTAYNNFFEFHSAVASYAMSKLLEFVS